MASIGFHLEIWKKMAARFLIDFDEQVLPLAERGGFRPAKGESKAKFPAAMVREMIEEAYIQGAADALKMAAELGQGEGEEVKE